MKRTILAAAVAAGLALSNTASAITVDGITINAGDFLQIGTVWEGTLASNGTLTVQNTGDELVGVGVVDTIKDANGNVVWASGDNGAYLAFYFDSYITEAINTLTANPVPINILFTGGEAHFYSLTSAFTPTGDYTADVATITGAGSLWMDTVAGTSRTCTAADACVDGVGTPVTLESFILSGDLGNVGTGTGSGFLNVTGAGAVDSYLNTNGLVGGNDMILTSSFTSETATAGYAASGSIDIRGTLAVPEPASLSLLGIGLAGLAAVRRRRTA